MSQPPTVLLMNRNALLAGTERVLLTCMEQGRLHGFRPVLACPEGPLAVEARARGFEVEICRFEWFQRSLSPIKLTRYAAALHRESARVTKVCRKYGVALLHPHGAASALYAVKASRTLGIPILYHLHDAIPPNRWMRLATRSMIPHLTRVLCVSEASRRMAEAMGVPRDRLQVLYNGVSPAFLGPRPEPAADVTGPGPHIGIVGLIVELKGQHVLLEAAEHLLRRFPTAHFWIIGRLCHPDDQPYLDRLHEMARRPALQGHVTFTGERNDVPRWMMAMDAVVMASVKPEALPTVVIEAMALGRRVVASNIGGQLEIIRGGETGLFVPPGDAVALADALHDLVTRPADDPMGERAAADARARFAPERFGQELAGVYDGILGRTGKRPAVCAPVAQTI